MKAALLLLLGFFAAFPAAATDLADIVPAELQFSDLKLGDAPRPEMRCVRGPCRGEDTFISIYKQPVAATFLGSVEISAPEYTFHQDRLFRIQFNLLCRHKSAESCLADIEKELDRQFGLALVKDSTTSGDEGVRIVRTHLTRSGAVVVLHSQANAFGWDKPCVSIYDQGLIDAVRSILNPGYVPQQLIAATWGNSP